MNDQLLSMYELDAQDRIDDSEPFATLTNRTQALSKIRENKNFDLLILGGGLLGVMVAHEAELQGIKVLLLEETGFGLDALSWDIRITRDLRIQPRELFRSRQMMRVLNRSRAPHLCANLVSDSHPVTGRTARFARRFLPLYGVDERLLIRESVLAARQEGALILGAVKPLYVEAESASGCYIVGFEDGLSKSVFEARVGGIVIDPTHGSLPTSRMGTKIIASSAPEVAGVQYVFEAVPRTAKSGHLFTSFDLTDGSFVSVARRALGSVEVSVVFGPRPLEATTISAVIQEACSESGWIIGAEVSQRAVAGGFGQKYSIAQNKGIFVCTHRGQWDCLQSTRTIVDALLRLAPEPRNFRKLSARLLSGNERNCEADSFRATARAQGISERTIECCLARWRGRVRYIPQFINGMREICPGVLRGEIDLAVRSDQVSSFDDLIFGALKLNTVPGWQDFLPALQERYQSFDL